MTAGKEERIRAMEENLPSRARPPTRDQLHQQEQQRVLIACKEAGKLLAQNVFSTVEQACLHFNISNDKRRLINYHEHAHARRLSQKPGETTVIQISTCSVPVCKNRGCPCSVEDADDAGSDAESVAEWTQTAWIYARSMFADASLSCQDIANNVEREHGIKRARQQYQRWRQRSQTIMPVMGQPTRLPPAAEDKLIETVAWLRKHRVQVAPMHLAMLAWQMALKLQVEANLPPPDKGFSRSWVLSFCDRHKEKLGVVTAEIVEDLRLHACTSGKLEKHFRILADALVELGWAQRNPDFDSSVAYDNKDPLNTRCQPIFINASKAARIASMDETRFTLNQAKEGKSVGGTKKTLVIKSEQLTGADKDWGEVVRNKSACDCTIVGGSMCSCNALPALYIFKGAFNPVEDLANGPVAQRPDGGRMQCCGTSNEKGSMTDEVMLQWLNAVFAPSFPDLSADNPVLLICDGYGSHLNIGFIRRCVELGVWVVLRPPHTSHVTQGEDVQGGHFHTFHREERIQKSLLKAALEVQPRRHNGFRDSQLKRSDIMKITAKAWEKAFSPDICFHAWQRIGIYPNFTRRPYWEIKAQEQQRRQAEVPSPVNAREAMEEAAARMQPDALGRAFLNVVSSDEEELHRKRINCSTRWALKGVITQGAALLEREDEERRREEDDQAKQVAKRARQDEIDRRRTDDAAAGQELHNALCANRTSTAQLTKKQIRCLLVYFGQRAPSDSKPVEDHREALHNFVSGRSDLPYSPAFARPAAAEDAAAADVADAPNDE